MADGAQPGNADMLRQHSGAEQGNTVSPPQIQQIMIGAGRIRPENRPLLICKPGKMSCAGCIHLIAPGAGGGTDHRNKLPGIASLLLQAADADACHMGAGAPPSGMGYRCDMPVGSIKEQGGAVREMSYQGNFPLGCPKSVHALIIPLPQQALAQISGNSLSKAGMMILPGKNSMSRNADTG